MTLPDLLEEFGEEIEADLLRVYGVDLLDLYRGTLTPRRVMVLIQGLPPGSALGRAMGGPAAWSEEVAATMASAWATQCAVLAAAGAKPSALPEAPAPPPVGWRRQRQEQQDRVSAKARRWLARNT